MTRPKAEAEQQFDDGNLRVTRWHFPPGAETGWHRHAFDYLVVPLTTGALTIDTGREKVTADLSSGVSYHRPAGVEHNVINDSDRDFTFVEIERLDRAG